MRTWLREQDRLDPSFHLLQRLAPSEDLSEQRRARRRERTTYARLLREAVLDRDFLRVIDGLGNIGSQHFLFLERAFPLMTKNQRAGWLQYVWCRAKIGCPASRARRLFRAVVPHPVFAVPKKWPDIVTVYRGSWGWTWSQALGRVRRGASWTTDRDVAIRFANRAPSRAISGVDPQRCLGVVRASRRRILAYITDDDYDERECIIGTSATARISYERVEPTPPLAEGAELNSGALDVEKGGG